MMVMAGKEHPGVRVIQLHADVAGRSVVARRVDQLHACEVRDIRPQNLGLVRMSQF